MIKLFQFKPFWDLPNPSPFCMKLETYLRMTDLPFEIINLSSKGRSPKGKMPYIEDKGKLVGDSALIIDYLQVKYGNKLDSHLSDEQRAIAHAMTKMLEENLYWAAAYTRWFMPENWKRVKNGYFGSLPAPLRAFVPALVRSLVMKKQMHGHGIGRHSEAEIIKIGIKDLTALADFLGEKTYFLGERPSSLDAVAYSFLANILFVPIESTLKEYVKSRKNLVRYCELMREKFYQKTSIPVFDTVES